MSAGAPPTPGCASQVIFFLVLRKSPSRLRSLSSGSAPSWDWPVTIEGRSEMVEDVWHVCVWSVGRELRREKESAC